MAIFYGQLEKAQLENLSTEPVGAPLGYIYHDTTADCAKVKTSDGFKKLLGVNGTAKVLTTSSAPNAGSGLAAPIASLALVESDGTVFVKVGSADLNWEQLQSDVLALRTTGGTMTGDINLSGTAKIKAGSLNGHIYSGTETIIDGGQGVSLPTQTFSPNSNAKALLIELLGPGGSYTHSHLSANNVIWVSGASGGGAYAKILLKNPSAYTIQFTLNTAYTRLSLGSYYIQSNSGSNSAVIASSAVIGIPAVGTVYTLRQVEGGGGGTVSSSGATPADITVLSQESGLYGDTAIFRYDNAARFSGASIDRGAISFSGGAGGCLNRDLAQKVGPFYNWADFAFTSSVAGKICPSTNELYAGYGQGAQATGSVTTGNAGTITIYSYGGPGRVRVTELI